MSEKISFQVGAGTITIETGSIAKQADGAVTVQLGETILLVAAVAASNAKPGQEFFPSRLIIVKELLLQENSPADILRGKGVLPKKKF